MVETLVEACRNAGLEFELKDKQPECIKALLESKDVFSVLQTGYGKTTIYGLLPHVYKELGESNAIVIVISPLISLMKSQVTNIEKLKVKSVYIGDTSTEG